MKYYPDSRLYINNQRSVMMYLFLRYPDSNYGYKASQAKSFADCIEFYDDWGPMTDFRLDIFYRMCDQLIEEIKANEALVATHKSRFENIDRNLYPDENYHILALDIIYTSQAYNFYGDMTFAPINAQARKLHFERVSKAKELADAVEKAKEAAEALAQAMEYLDKELTEGVTVKHRMFGEGSVVKCNHIVIDRKTDTIEYTYKIGTECDVTRKYHVAQGVSNFLDELEYQNLFVEFEEKELDAIISEDDEATYTATVDFLRGPSRIVAGRYDSNVFSFI